MGLVNVEILRLGDDGRRCRHTREGLHRVCACTAAQIASKCRTARLADAVRWNLAVWGLCAVRTSYSAGLHCGRV